MDSISGKFTQKNEKPQTQKDKALNEMLKALVALVGTARSELATTCPPGRAQPDRGGACLPLLCFIRKGHCPDRGAVCLLKVQGQTGKFNYAFGQAIQVGQVFNDHHVRFEKDLVDGVVPGIYTVR